MLVPILPTDANCEGSTNNKSISNYDKLQKYQYFSVIWQKFAYTQLLLIYRMPRKFNLMQFFTIKLSFVNFFNNYFKALSTLTLHTISKQVSTISEQNVIYTNLVSNQGKLWPKSSNSKKLHFSIIMFSRTQYIHATQTALSHFTVTQI